MNLAIAKVKKDKSWQNKKKKQKSLCPSMISLSGFHICKIYDKSRASSLSNKEKAIKELFSF